ncbi:MAG: tetratricopeptide repeat protein [Nostoc sp.]|uniref:tetratricopeptide repeat protein n=1 Tax=Nostoc sp. TaxID=1180 RepID=UPI002FFC0A55
MTLELTDWDKDLPSEINEEYQALVRTLNFTEGFGLLFVRCSPAEGVQLITKIKENITNKNIEVIRLEEAVTNLYEKIDSLENKEKINILFITGLEHSFYEYEECKRLMGWNSRDIYSYSWKGVPPVLINLNQQRERLKDKFNICFVLLLPIFAIKYFLQRAPDFFDWRSGLFEFPIDSETLEKESSRIIKDADYEKYLSLTKEERTQEIIAIQELIAEDNQTPDHQYDLLINLGKLQSAEEDCQGYEEAITSFTEALKINPDYHDAWNWHGYLLDKLGRNEEAIASYDQALKINSDDYYAWKGRGIALEQLGRYEEALISLDKALELEFKNDLSNLYYAWKWRGITLNELGRYEEALISLDKALELEPKDDLSDLFSVWNWRGITLKQLDRYEEAIASYDQALKIKPDDYEIWNYRGNALSNLGRNEEAIFSYDKALEIQPDAHKAWNNRGKALFDLGRNEEAIASYDKALQIQPDFTLDRLK